MNEQSKQKQTHLAVAAGGSGKGPGGPPINPPIATARPPHPPETLTQTFSRAADKPKINRKSSTIQERIAALEAKRSRPTSTIRPPGLGTVNPSLDLKRDYKITHEVRRLQKLATRQNQAREAFAKASLKGTAQLAFKRSARGLRM